MSNERLTPVIEKEPALDEEWFAEYKRIASFEAYQFWGGDPEKRKNEKDKFFASGESVNPDFDYPKLNAEQLEEMEQNLRAFKKKILEPEDLDFKERQYLKAQKLGNTGVELTEEEKKHQPLQRLYRWRINEKIAEVLLLKAAANKEMEKYKLGSEYVFGNPSPEVFAYTTQRMQERARQASTQQDNPILQQAAQEFLQVIPAMDSTYSSLQFPSQEIAQEALAKTREEMSDLLTIPFPEDLTQQMKPEEIKPIFEEALQLLKADGWKVAILPNARAFGISQAKETAQVAGLSTPTVQRIKELVVHELGTHVRRRLNGERSRLKLLSLGLDRYDQGEEGVATFTEQSVKASAKEFEGLNLHFAISLIMGLDGKKRDFAETFAIMKKYYYFDFLSKGMDEQEASAKAAEEAYNICSRVKGGTSPEAKGVAFTKDVLYALGNVGVWEVVGKKPEQIAKLYIGKYDPANSRHIEMLTKLGILDEELKQLES